MNSAHRTVSRLAAGGATATLLVTGIATSADAATSTYPHITTAAAKAAIPPAAKLPGGVKLVGKVVVTKRAVAVPCATVPKVLSFPGANAVGALYANPVQDENSPKNLIWHISAVVFTTPAKAAAAAAVLTKAEKACPDHKTTVGNGYTETVLRTLSAKYAVSSWHGYRTIDHISGTGLAGGLAARDFTTYLTRGNVIVSIEEVAPNLPGTGPIQDARRKAVTTLVLARFAAVT